MASGSKRSLEIVIKAKDLASAEFAKTQSWLNALTGSADKTTQTIAKGFKGGVISSIKDSVTELKAFVRGFGLIQAGKLLYGLVQDWLEVRQKTKEAREEFDLYLRLSGKGGSGKQSLEEFRASIGKIQGESLKLSESQQTQIAILTQQYKLYQGQAEALAKDAVFLAERIAAFKDDPVKAFDALAKSTAGFHGELSKALNLEVKDGKAANAVRLERLAIEQDLIAAQRQSEISSVLSGFGGLSLGAQARAAELKEEARAARDLAEAYRAQIQVTEALNPLQDEQNRKNQEAIQILRDRAAAAAAAADEEERDRKSLRPDPNDFIGGLRSGFEEFRREITDFHEQARGTVVSLLRGVSDIGANAIEALITKTAKARDALKQFAADMLRLLARLVAQLAVNQFIGALFNAIGGAATGGAYRESLGSEPVPGGGGDGGGASASSFGGAGASRLKNIGNRTIGGGSGGSGWGGGPTINLYIQAWDADSVRRAMPEIMAEIEKRLGGSRSFRLAVKDAAA